MLLEDDISTRLAAEVDDVGTGGGSLSAKLTGETPPIAYQNLTDGGSSAPVPAAPVVVALSATTPATTAPTAQPASSSSGSSSFIGRTLGSVHGALTDTSAALSASGEKAAKAAGVSDETAAKLGNLVPWLIVAVLVGIGSAVYAFRRRLFSHHVTA